MRPEKAGKRGTQKKGRGPPSTQPPGCSNWLLWGVMAALIYMLLRPFWAAGPVGDPMAYSHFRQEVAAGNVVEVTIRGQGITGTLKEPVEVVEEADTTLVTEFLTNLPAFGDDTLLPLLLEQNVAVEVIPEGDTAWVQLFLIGFLPFLLLGAILYLSMRRSAGAAQSLFSMGRSGARKYQREKSATTFDDVAGAAGAKKELQEVVEFLRDPKRFHDLGAEVPKGVLLVGPPGTGKTLLARAVAGEAHVSFFIITGSDFMEMFVGVGAKRVRDLFKQAKEGAPSIIFIDELDSIGRQRGAGLGGGHDEREQTLNQLLSELDGFEPAENVIVLAATNRPDILDPALLRPGRFDRRISVDLPSASERLEILKLHARAMPLEPELDLEPMARGTPGFSGADLKNLLNEAALTAGREGKEQIGAGELEAARDRILMGLKREGLALTEEELRLLACHEGGHALVGAALPHSDPVHKVTIVPRGRAMGSTHQLPERERYLWRREELLDRLAMTLAGRAAEELIFGTATSGAEDDLEKATKLARTMVLRWGMSPELGLFASGAREEQVFLGEEISRQKDHSEETAREVDREVRRILGEAYDRARETLETHGKALERVMELLLEKEEITGQEVEELLEASE
jgi:cell division protease FtsH